jgi:uncharacterized protein YebE (UPF0316 family)
MLEAIQPALLIFSLRIIDVPLYTMRIMMVMRGRKGLAWMFAICQSMVFVTAITSVISDIGNWTKVVGYAAGFATGNVVGMLIEQRLAIGISHLRIVSSGYGIEIAEELRAAGFGVTEISGQGKDGMVELISCSVQRRKTNQALAIVDRIDQDAYVTVENIRSVSKGYWPK